jgi:nitrous oxidase accessory protein NosD
VVVGVVVTLAVPVLLASPTAVVIGLIVREASEVSVTYPAAVVLGETVRSAVVDLLAEPAAVVLGVIVSEAEVTCTHVAEAVREDCALRDEAEEWVWRAEPVRVLWEEITTSAEETTVTLEVRLLWAVRDAAARIVP